MQDRDKRLDELQTENRRQQSDLGEMSDQIQKQIKETFDVLHKQATIFGEKLDQQTHE